MEVKLKPETIYINFNRDSEPIPMPMDVEKIEGTVFDICFLTRRKNWHENWAIVHRPTGTIVYQGMSYGEQTKVQAIELAVDALTGQCYDKGITIGQLLFDGTEQDPLVELIMKNNVPPTLNE